MRLHLYAVAILAGLVVLWVVVMGVALSASALPDDHEGAAVAVFPPGYGDREAVLAAVIGAGALPVRQTWFRTVWIVSGEETGFVPRLRAAGAWGVFAPDLFRPVASGGCFSTGTPLDGR